MLLVQEDPNKSYNWDSVDKKKQKQTKEASPTSMTNPKGKLDGKAFMHLLLTELKYQDPTQPMDSEKMLSQTSQLATLETQEATNQMMKDLTEQLRAEKLSGANTQAISTIGKLATLGDVKLAVTDDLEKLDFDIYFDKEVANGHINIRDKDNNLVVQLPIQAGSKGTQTISWTLRNSLGERVVPGPYQVEAEYIGADNAKHKVIPGTYPVEAVKFVDGLAHVKLGSKYIPMSEVKEFIRNMEEIL